MEKYGALVTSNFSLFQMPINWLTVSQDDSGNVVMQGGSFETVVSDSSLLVPKAPLIPFWSQSQIVVGQDR